MKYQGELLLIVLLALALLVRPAFLKNMLNTFVGRVFMLVAILALASKNKNYGFLGALIMISLLQSFREGFEGADDLDKLGKEKKDDDHKEEDDTSDGKEEKKDEEMKKECEEGDDSEECAEKKDSKEKKEDESSEKEGFSLLPRMDMRFSEMDPLEAENTVRPKPSSMYPSPDPKTRGQNTTFVNSVIGTVKGLFSKA